MLEDILMARRAARNSDVNACQDQDLDMQPTKKVCKTLDDLKNDIIEEDPKNKKMLLSAVNLLEKFLNCKKISDDW